MIRREIALQLLQDTEPESPVTIPGIVLLDLCNAVLNVHAIADELSNRDGASKQMADLLTAAAEHNRNSISKMSMAGLQ